jgi:hypothetical protein
MLTTNNVGRDREACTIDTDGGGLSTFLICSDDDAGVISSHTTEAESTSWTIESVSFSALLRASNVLVFGASRTSLATVAVCKKNDTLTKKSVS